MMRIDLLRDDPNLTKESFHLSEHILSQCEAADIDPRVAVAAMVVALSSTLAFFAKDEARLEIGMDGVCDSLRAMTHKAFETFHDKRTADH